MKKSPNSQDGEWLSRCEDFEQSVLKYKSVRFSHFVSPHDLALFVKRYQLSPDVKFMSYGGSEDAERVILGFFPDFLEIENKDFPIVPLKISNLGTLNHRDVLGAILGLGIKREMVGDIYFDDGFAFIMCEKTAADYILYNLKTVGRQNVDVVACELHETFSLEHKFEEFNVIVASTRLDAVVSTAARMSRNDASRHILSENVNLNFMTEENPDKKVVPGDVISIRHHGRFLIDDAIGETKKGRIILKIKKYI